MARRARSRLAKLMSERHVRALYVPTIEEIEKWFKIINKEVFKGTLKPFRRIEIRRRHGTWAECSGAIDKETGERYCELSFNHHVKSKRHMVSILAHEMVHARDWQVFQEMTHGERFMLWKDNFRKFGVVLNIAQRT